MKEEFIHWLWKNQFFDGRSLCDREAGSIGVITPGVYNRDSGPDFFNTRLIIGGTEWAGNTEIHVNASDWYRHGHHIDHAYDNVILHIVYNEDADVYTASGRRLITIRLVFDPVLWENYLDFMNNPSPLPCSGLIGLTDGFRIKHWLWSIAVERLERKHDDIREILSKTGNDWEETLYRLVTRYFGFRVNTDPFGMLAARLPLKIIRKHSDQLIQVEALLYGTAGLLDEALFREAVNDSYYLLLLREYRVLRAKYSLQPVDGWLWKFHRLRPANFPTVRLSQLAALLSHSDGLFSRVLGCSDRESLRALLSVSASSYWNNHYQFGREVPPVAGRAGRQSADLLIINAIVPLLFVYGKVRQQQEWCDRAVEILDSLPPEKNSVVTDFTRAGLKPESAFASQALLELRNMRCRYHRCLDCTIGSSLIAMGQKIRRSDSLFLEP
ncbi:MAG TPA: DUF2851 family protein [Bacteroidales bacterium]|jgi:hypothetical protein|nr:DUF2851 family protein [Bacteroidales bacterium]HNY57405.1 DUF2851 family protein [Bacteroidales bacterium]HOH15588.1 DUF2851 family protein [Bacteroidales bacterium]HPH74174.1 DUF2851 family protein [Bacteroidales bacterium]HPK85244.1 DUF2851 family protein [Bacteroidales bacterium]